jgi:hypothetical protein
MSRCLVASTGLQSEHIGTAMTLPPPDLKLDSSTMHCCQKIPMKNSALPKRDQSEPNAFSPRSRSLMSWRVPTLRLLRIVHCDKVLWSLEHPHCLPGGACMDAIRCKHASTPLSPKRRRRATRVCPRMRCRLRFPLPTFQSMGCMAAGRGHPSHELEIVLNRAVIAASAAAALTCCPRCPGRPISPDAAAVRCEIMLSGVVRPLLLSARNCRTCAIRRMAMPHRASCLIAQAPL